MKSFNDYLIVTDLDGTLYKRQNDIPKVNIDAINKFVSMGGKFAVATGRGIEATRFITEAIDIPNPIIVNNGHSIYDFNNEKIVYNVYLPDSIKLFVKKIVEKFPSAGVELYSDRKLYVLSNNHVITEHLEYEHVSFEKISFDELENIKLSKLLIADDEDVLLNIIEYAKSLEGDEFSSASFKTIRTSRLFLEGVCKSINKGTAVHELVKVLNLSGEHVFTIGNFYNDMELVQSAFGAWIKDTPNELLPFGKYVTSKTCAEGGFAEFLEYIMKEK